MNSVSDYRRAYGETRVHRALQVLEIDARPWVVFERPLYWLTVNW